MKSIDYYNKKYNRNKLLLVMILKYEGEIFKDHELKKEWTFSSFAVANIDEENKLYNALDEEEKFYNVEASIAEVGEEIVQIVDLASKVLNINGRFISKKQIYDSMKKSGMYFRDCDDAKTHEKSKLKKL